MGTSPGIRYREAQVRVAAIGSSLDEQDAAVTIAGSPKWSARDVLAHLTGAAEDFSTGNMAGAPGDAWSAAQVARAEGQSVDEVIGRWEQVGPAIMAALDGRHVPLIPLWDVLTHEADVRETHRLGRLDDEIVDEMLGGFCRGFAKRYGGPGCLELHADDGAAWTYGEGEPTAVLTTSPYELVRGIFSRRSTKQMLAWQWEGSDPADYLPHITVFGLRDDDQPIP